MPNILIYGLVVLAGLIFQSLLRGPTLMIISMIVGILSGFLAATFSTVLPLLFASGTMIRMLIGGYTKCFVLMLMYIAAGVLIGFLF